MLQMQDTAGTRAGMRRAKRKPHLQAIAEVWPCLCMPLLDVLTPSCDCPGKLQDCRRSITGC